jgi:hypothetical protein
MPYLRSPSNRDPDLIQLLPPERVSSVDPLLANHLPMVLVALHRMGATDERLEAYCDVYREQNGLVPVPQSVGAVVKL